MMMPSIMASFASLHSWEPGSAINGSAKLSSGHNNAGICNFVRGPSSCLCVCLLDFV
jgi:hypothetical protein